MQKQNGHRHIKWCNGAILQEYSKLHMWTLFNLYDSSRVKVVLDCIILSFTLNQISLDCGKLFLLECLPTQHSLRQFI